MQGITWSCSTVLQSTLATANAAGVSVCTDLPVLRDIDTWEDLTEWLQSVRGQGSHTPVSRASSAKEIRDSSALQAGRKALIDLASRLVEGSSRT